MDWTKAKNIILALLILLNIFLFINVINVKSSFSASAQYKKNAEQALEAAGVIVKGTIPSDNKPLSRISYFEKDPSEYERIVSILFGENYNNFSISGSTRWENEKTVFQLFEDTFVYTDKTGMTTFNVTDEKKLNKQILLWIKNNGLSNIYFAQKRLIKEGNIITAEYIQKYNKMPLFSNNIIFTIEDNRLCKIEGSLKVFFNIKSSKQKDEIISPSIVLLTGQDKVQGVISSIILGYLRPKNEGLYDIPVWQINFHAGSEIYFNAYTGEWIGLSQ